MTVLILKTVIFVDFAKNILVIFPQIHKILTFISTVPNWDDLDSWMSYYLSSMFSSCEVITLCHKFQMASSSLHLLIYLLKVRIILYVIWILTKRTATAPNDYVNHIGNSNELNRYICVKLDSDDEDYDGDSHSVDKKI